MIAAPIVTVDISARCICQNESLRCCHDVRPSICPSGTGVHCDRTVHFRADLSLWLNSPIFWAPWHQSMSIYSLPSFSSSIWKRGRVWMCKLDVISQERWKIEVKLLLTPNSKLYMLHRLVRQRMTLSDLKCLTSTLCASRAISAELVVRAR